MKFKFYKSYYGDGRVVFTFTTLRELLKFDRRVMQPNHNPLNKVVGFSNIMIPIIGQIYQGKRYLRVRFTNKER